MLFVIPRTHPKPESLRHRRFLTRRRRMSKRLILLAFCCSVFAAADLAQPAFAQCTYDWKPGDVLPGVNGQVNAVTTWDPDGAGPQSELLIVGGKFTQAGDTLANNIAAWNGTSWQPLGTGVSDIGAYAAVYALDVYNGELIALGNFSSAGGVAASQIARWNGTAWQPLGTGLDYGGYTYGLTVYNGELIAGGPFSNAGGVPASHIARWNGTAWQALGAGTVSYVHALCVYNGELLLRAVNVEHRAVYAAA